MKKSLKKLVVMSLASVLALGAVETGMQVAFADDDDDWEDYYDYDDDDWDDYDDDWDDYYEDYYDYDDYDDYDDDDYYDDLEDQIEDQLEALYGDDFDDDEYERNFRATLDKGTFTLPTGEVVNPINTEKVNYQTEEERFQVTPEDAPEQGLAVGGQLETGETVEQINVNSNQPIPQIAQENQNNKEALYQEAKEVNNENTANTIDQNGQGQEVAVKANEKTQNDFNQERFIDVNLLNQEFVNLLNAERQAQGLAPVEYGTHLQQGVDTRATDLASIGDIRVNNQPHVRLDGSSYVEDFRYLGAGANTIGENTAMVAYTGNPYELVSEKALAEQFYQQWKESPSHYQNMMDPNYKHSAISVKMGQHNRQDGNQWNSIIAVQALDQQ